MQSSRAPFAGAWLNTPLSDPLLRLSNKLFGMAIRLRLGLAPQENLPSKCVCGSLVEEPHHFLACHHLKPVLTVRHDRIVALLARLARAGGITTEVESALDEGKRPDANFSSCSCLSHRRVGDAPCGKDLCQGSGQPTGCRSSQRKREELRIWRFRETRDWISSPL